jgi:acetyl esterase/lipase
VSRRCIALNAVLRAVVKPRLARLRDPRAARRDFAVFGALFLPAPRGFGLWRAAGADPLAGGPLGGRAVLWFHGGAFVAGSSRTHRGLAGRLSRAAGVPVVLPDYRLAPRHPLPAAQADARAAWDRLRAAGLPAGGIVVGGDSAGGGLALSLLAALCAEGTPPAACIAVSPWADLTGSGVSMVANREADPMLPAGRLGDLLGFVLGDAPADDPRVSPLFARYPGSSPVLLMASQTEILRDDAIGMAARLRSEGAEVTLRLWPDAPHAWPIFGDWLPESREAVAVAATFARRHLAADQPTVVSDSR